MNFEESTPSTKMEFQDKILRVSHMLNTLQEVESSTTAPFILYHTFTIHFSQTDIQKPLGAKQSWRVFSLKQYDFKNIKEQLGSETVEFSQI